MEIALREWQMEEVPGVAEILNNRHVLDKLRDGLLRSKWGAVAGL